MIEQQKTPPLINTAWTKALEEAKKISLPNRLSKRPQAEGFTIDGPTSKDLDDAIWVRTADDAGVTILVHIADVAELVKIGSALDQAAMVRARTLYHRQGNTPMLPYALSENLLSLMPNQQRPTLTVEIALDQNAEIRKVDLYETQLVSCKRFSYEEADKACNDPSHPLHDQLKLCQRWAAKLSKRRKASGAFGGMVGAGDTLLDEEGRIIDSPGGNFHSQRIIMEFMILANRAVAQWCADRDLPILYRNHTAKVIAPERSELIQALFTSGNVAMMRQQLQNWLNRAVYSPALVGHFALNLTAYTHFTSPIRRLPDLINHRIIKAVLQEQASPYPSVELSNIADHIEDVNRQAEESSKAFFKEQAKAEHSKQLAKVEGLTQLSAKEFTRVLRHGIRENNVAPLKPALNQRLSDGSLAIHDLFLLLLENQDNALQEIALEALKSRVCDAPSIMSIANNILPQWEEVSFIEQKSKKNFVCWAVVTVDGQSMTSRLPGAGKKKQLAKHHGCFAWLNAHVSGKLVEPEQRQLPSGAEPQPNLIKDDSELKKHPSLTTHLKDGQNFIGLLGELCQSNQWALPSYSMTEVDDGFLCTCEGKAGDIPYKGEGTGTRKKQAKKLAAKEALRFLQTAL